MGKKSNRSRVLSQKSRIEILVAQYGFLGVVTAALLGTVGTVVAGYFAYLGIQAQLSVPLNATQTIEARFLLTLSPSQTLTPSPTVTIVPTATQRIAIVTSAPFDPSDVVFPAPTIGAQLDFSPKDNINIEGFRRSPFNGIFMSETTIERFAPSWYAAYSDGSHIQAESHICLMNTIDFTPFVQTGPLNIKTSRISLYFAIYSDDRYSYEVQEIEVLISEFEPMDSNIVAVAIGIPGAGGQGFPLQDVQALKTWVDGIANTVYKMDFEDFVLGPNNGVNITLPIAMSEPGYYQFIIKVNGVATPTYAGDPAGKLSLTSNVLDYSWAKLNDPRDYQIEEIKDVFGNKIEINLRPCP